MAHIEGKGGKPPKTICLDFDGTLCDFAFPGIGAIKKGAKDATKLFKYMGYYIIIYSCRTSHHHYEIFGGDPDSSTLERPHVIEMQNWLDANGIVYDEIDDGSKGKPLADYYVDDKAIRFENNWHEIAMGIFNAE